MFEVVQKWLLFKKNEMSLCEGDRPGQERADDGNLHDYLRADAGLSTSGDERAAHPCHLRMRSRCV